MGAMDESAIRRACRLVGGLTALAQKLNVTAQAVHQWVQKGRVPAERARQIEAATEGRVTCHELRPDLYPAEPAGQPLTAARTAA